MYTAVSSTRKRSLILMRNSMKTILSLLHRDLTLLNKATKTMFQKVSGSAIYLEYRTGKILAKSPEIMAVVMLKIDKQQTNVSMTYVVD